MEMLLKEITAQLEELLENGTIEECQRLNDAMLVQEEKCLLDSTALPMHFTGELDSSIAFVELNPGRGPLCPQITKNGLVLDKFGLKPSPVITDVTSYLQFFENFGHYKAESSRINNQAISKFDNKQLNFFSGFTRQKLEAGKKYTYDDVVKIRREKLQLEIVPFMSSRFSFKIFSPVYIKSRVGRVGEIICSSMRDYVFVTGNDKEIFRNFGVDTFKSYSIPNKKHSVYIGAKMIDGVRYCFLKSYKAQGFDGIHMQEYGYLSRRILDDL